MILSQEMLSRIILAVLAVALVNLVWLIFLELRLKRLFRGGGTKNLQGVLAEIQEGLIYFSKKQGEIDSVLQHLESRVTRSAQHLGIVRFNPYSEIGSDQSFSIAVLDEKRNGFVVSGLYGREQSRVYAKPVENGISSYNLSGEEKMAIQKALDRYV